MSTMQETTTAQATDTTGSAPARRRGVIARNVALGGFVGGAAIMTSGCTLSDISTILSILRLLGIGA